jgi:hypothetical protein
VNCCQLSPFGNPLRILALRLLCYSGRFRPILELLFPGHVYCLPLSKHILGVSLARQKTRHAGESIRNRFLQIYGPSLKLHRQATLVPRFVAVLQSLAPLVGSKHNADKIACGRFCCVPGFGEGEESNVAIKHSRCFSPVRKTTVFQTKSNTHQISLLSVRQICSTIF